MPEFSKCVIYFEQRYIFQGQIREFYDHDLSNYALDKISDRTPEDCKKIIEKRNATDNAIYDYYQKHPELQKPEGLPDCASCGGDCCSCH